MWRPAPTRSSCSSSRRRTPTSSAVAWSRASWPPSPAADRGADRSLDFDPSGDQGAQACRDRGIPLQPRGREDFARFFTGLELIDPGIIALHRWRADGDRRDATDAEVSMYGAVGRKS
ncbi:SAM-dependent methyltransferase [Frankia sp. R82]|uniref:SAM-dependent methyltransferase n=1 Tax=Frankia sp. R82 TaxID=2950553 RepID=UPI0027E3938A|nr:SAM-dependent methyltransferase [Frankia sp. R82]